jgi:hypothetical protein
MLLDLKNFFSFELAGEHPSSKKFSKSKTQKYPYITLAKELGGWVRKNPKLC